MTVRGTKRGKGTRRATGRRRGSERRTGSGARIGIRTGRRIGREWVIFIKIFPEC